MKAKMLMDAVKILGVNGTTELDIKGLAFDSRQVKTGYAFFAVRGSREDGNRFVQDALDRGAVMVVSADATKLGRGHVLFVQVHDVRQAMAEMATIFYGNPSERLQIAGITGTNGKTTSANMLRDILNSAGRKPGLIGTIRYEIGDRSIPASRTTPEAIDLQRMLAEMVQSGCQSAVMEVSSHGLVQKRVWNIDYDVGVFTNLTHDHLDYHKTEEEYFQAKSLLFRDLCAKPDRTAVLNIDDPHGVKLAAITEKRTHIVTYGIENPTAVLRAENLVLNAGGNVFDIVSPWGNEKLCLNLPGRFNVYNALAAIGAAGAMGVALKDIVATLATVRSVPGRLEEIPTGAGFQAFVDYAHTEDALKNVLATIREITKGRVIMVFGCGGDRDKSKRPLMGAVAAELADYSILTSDNPRKENPLEIISQIRAGFAGQDNFEVVEDRYEAIVRALSLADRDDVVLVAGKGHENYQEFADTVIPFDDRQVVRECLGVKD